MTQSRYAKTPSPTARTLNNEKHVINVGRAITRIHEITTFIH